MNSGRAVILAAFLALSPPVSLFAQDRPLLSPPPEDGSVGHTVYEASCMECHSGDTSARAPRMTALSAMTPRAILAALTEGRMRRHGEDLTPDQRQAVSEWLTGKELTETRMPDAAFCSARPTGPGEVHWSGWGGGNGEAGYRDASSGVTGADLGGLELAWAFAFPDAGQVRSKPAVVGDRVIIGSAYGEVYSIDLESGCAHWVFAADAAVRGGIAIGDGPNGRQTAFFSDFRGNAYAIDAASGELLWRQGTGSHPDHTNTGTVTVHDGRVFVPLSSMEIVTANNPEYECCTSAGAIVALSAGTGEELWRFRTVAEEARPTGEQNEAGARRLGPSGAPIWSSPTVDAARGLLYVGTGENYTHPTTETSDAIIALDMQTGEMRWSHQGTADDAWNMACTIPRNFDNCPVASGPDFDFGMSPIIATRPDGTQILVAGQKSGMVWAFDPDANGELVWAKKVGKGSALGGVHWGIAADDRRVYVPNSDNPFAVMRDPRTGELSHPSGTEPVGTGVYALDLGAGEVIWKADADPTVCQGRAGCQPFYSAASTVIEGAVLAGSLDGHMRAWSTDDGTLLWDFDTAREFETVNGVPGKGGSIDGPGPVVAQGTVLVMSGYDMFSEMPGNLLLAFRKPR